MTDETTPQKPDPDDPDQDETLLADTDGQVPDVRTDPAEE